jgi:hypothetical protein
MATAVNNAAGNNLPASTPQVAATASTGRAATSESSTTPYPAAKVARRHNYGAAVRLNNTRDLGKRVKDTAGHAVEGRSFADLKHVGDGYGVT